LKQIVYKNYNQLKAKYSFQSEDKTRSCVQNKISFYSNLH